MSSLTPAMIRYYKEHASDNLQPNMIAINVCGTLLPYIAVALRFIARKNSVVTIGVDDWLILAALFPLTGYAISSLLSVHFGAGRHIIFLKSARSYSETYIATITAYAACIVLTKSSILYFYNRIFPSKSLVRTSWALEFIIVVYNVAVVLTTALECIPFSSLWTGKKDNCIRTVLPFTILGAVNVITDVLILALPIKFVVNLRMRTARKIQVCGIFLLGSV
ncbi:hypothetical protein MMC28_011039, partial [Mycoblastus sanguinarius]|nr:hypothetical protein [Mycoblastus sanguinarius]